jgi:acyl-CoA thioester hydrolase
MVGPADEQIRATSDREGYAHWDSVTTRWSDNDIYGHINNAVYYEFIDAVVNRYLIDQGVLEPERSEVIGIVVESHCRFPKPITYPQAIDAGLKVVRIGTSSVAYEVGMFTEGESEASAVGGFTHVFVKRNEGRPVPIPTGLRAALQRIA